ncbi:16S rRNA (cytosine967-C5)-methyltransferase [Primorskyibacter sedentarius]|uniref:16S rRNA (Cytosine967-C5)-methyltransferase n=1 Tax=Primorskyibacter sedentarius TaxID=745311 RepID=A0A4R3J3T5_9RHOB|nr:transcription antitermination factor NusB [Primorskyibacter sedentarius]TCS60499.1 16S rRNA (cytosine967-C5)-methyltransferase [Primorskyibacter sedentarius]
MTKPQKPMSARRMALRLLDQVLEKRCLLSEVTQGPAWDAMAPQDRAAAQRLTLDVLRGLERADRLLKPHLRKAPPVSVQNVLRLAVVELCMGGAAHGVVNEAVTLVGSDQKTRHLKGLVNAVLRKLVDAAPAEWAILRVPRLPKWLRGPLVAAWGGEAVLAMEAAHFAGAPLDLTAKGDPQALAEATGGTLLPTGSVRLSAGGQVSALPGYDEGTFWVQDAAAALPARLLNAQPGETVLDMCAAPGGKTMQLAAAGASVTALDISEQRMARVRQNLSRTGLKAEIVTEDGLEHQGSYDAILLDAPCSATGTIRRHPDLPHAREGDEIGGLIALQAAMLDHAVQLLKPGGRMVFCTCSLIPDEGECQVEEALARHPELKVVAPNLPGVEPDWITPEGGVRLRPDYWSDTGGMDGFYMALLTKA